MRPLHLSMEAFGSFRHEKVDFEALGKGLYLIAGDTGAGKTTIFDAIVFALYGVASGADRRPEMLHSDYCSKGEDTRVTLDFEQSGRCYTVWRRLHYAKSRGADGYSEKAAPSAELSGEDQPVIEKSEDVTRRVIELTGLNADQFRKIAMLAQGEFRAFLRDEKNRNEILSKLFDDSLYRRFEGLLKDAASMLESERGEQLRSIALAVDPQTLALTEDMPDEERAMLRPESDRLVEGLTGLIERERERDMAVRGQLEETEARLQTLRLRLASGQRINQALDTLEERRAELAVLRGQEDGMAMRLRRAEEADRAIHGVAPLERAMNEAAEARRRAEDVLKQAQETAARLAGALQSAEEAKREQAALRPEAQEALSEAAAIEKTLPDYRRRALMQARTDAARRRELEMLAARDRQSGELAGIDDALARGQETLNARKDAQEQYYSADKTLTGAEQRVAAIEGENGLRAVLEAAAQRRREYDAEKRRYDALQEKATSLDKRSKELSDAFLAGQSGVIGERMRSKLLERGSVTCPVCFARYRAEDHPRFAQRGQSVPTQEEVEAAEAERDRANQAYAEARNRVSALIASFESLCDSAAGQAKALGLEPSYEALAADGVLEGVIRQARGARDDARRGRLEAKARMDEWQRAREDVEKLSRRRMDCEASLRESIEALSAAGRDRAAAEGELSGMAALPYADEEAARSAAGRLRVRAQEIERGIAQAEEEARRAAEAASRAAGEAAHARMGLDQAGLRQTAAEQAFAGAIVSSGFADEASYRAALPAAADYEGWLKAERNAQTAYRTARAAAESALRAAEQAASDHPQRVDLSETEQAIAEEDGKRQTLDAQRGEINARSVRYRTALDQVARAKARLAESDAAAARLGRLSVLANNADAGATESKTSFSRFIQSYVFREILREANRHLDVMTGGKYELVYRGQARDGRSNSGLLIDVLDHLTGETRNTASLSGGESFQASLALALGLSGVVQQRSGVRRVDAMFIDEGFGTLSQAELEAAVGLLVSIAGEDRQIGIISHVAALEESIENQIRVRKGKNGSVVEIRR